MNSGRRIRAPPPMPDNAVAARQAFSRFKADPTSFLASMHLRNVIDFAEGVADRGSQGKVAGDIARELVGVVDNAAPQSRSRLMEIIAKELLKPSAVKDAVREIIRGRSRQFALLRAAESPSTEKTGTTRSFEFHIQKFIKENPRFAGLGKLVVDVDAGSEVKVEKKDPFPPGLLPWWYEQRWRLLVGTVITGLVIFSAVVGFSGPGANTQIQAPQIADSPGRRSSADGGAARADRAQDDGNRITPDDVTILRAVNEAVRRKDAPLNLQQIFDIYNYVVTNIRYLTVSDRAIPRWPRETLEAHWGDCKSMSVLLASMLEAIGAKTVLISWHDATTREGHEYVGVLISDDQALEARQQAERIARRMIERTYSRTIGHHYQRPLRLVFREFPIGGRTQLYLVLDATTGRNGVPGVALSRPDIERVEESRPGHRGNAPDLR